MFKIKNYSLAYVIELIVSYNMEQMSRFLTILLLNKKI